MYLKRYIQIIIFIMKYYYFKEEYERIPAYLFHFLANAHFRISALDMEYSVYTTPL